jgi:surfeit locus 1 family protein
MKIIGLYFSRRWWWTTLFMLLIVAVTIRLGFWQLDRMRKMHLTVEHSRAMLAAEELNLNLLTDTSDLLSMEYRPAIAHGWYDFENQVALRNQYWGDPEGAAEYGYHLLTPLVLDSGLAVLVDRGWIPGNYNVPAEWHQFDEETRATVRGVLRVPLLKGEMGGQLPDPTAVPGEPRLDFWNYIDIARIEAQLPYQFLPVYLQEAPNADALVLPYKSSPEIDLSEGTHFEYAMMWFFYGALVFFGYPVYLRRHEANRFYNSDARGA